MKNQTPNKMSETEGPACPTPTAPSGAASSTTNQEGEISNPADEGLISKHELARRLHKTLRTIEHWQRRGMIPYIKCGRAVYYNWSAVLAHLQSQFRICRNQARPQPLRIPVIGTAVDITRKDKTR